MILWNFDLLWKTMVLWKKTMVLWKFDLLWKTMILWNFDLFEKLWYCGKNYDTMELWFTIKNYCTMEKTMVLWTKLLYYTENYGTSIYEEKKHCRLPKTKRLLFITKKNHGKISKVLNRFIALEIWLTMEKLWYYGKNYSTIPKTMELWFTMEKKLWYMY